MSEILDWVMGIFLAMIVISSLIFVANSLNNSIKYNDLKDAIERCNENLGVGNWTFTESEDYYSCSKASMTTTSTTTYTTTNTTTCYVNEVEVPCP